MLKQVDLLKEVLREESFLIIILDACRADYFEKIRAPEKLGGRYQRVWSAGSHTLDFLENIFTEDHYDLVYISANPHVNTKNIFFPATKKFRKVVELWNFAWDPELQTVPASKVYIATLVKLSQGERKIVAHFIQPHEPFIGETKLIRGNLWQTKQFVEKGEPGTPDPISDVDIELLKKAYEDNVRYVVKWVAKLLKYAKKHNLKKIIVTADHGEILDEAPVTYDRHPRGLAWRCLREVPWLEVR